jgi:hypothetical protein
MASCRVLDRLQPPRPERPLLGRASRALAARDEDVGGRPTAGGLRPRSPIAPRRALSLSAVVAFALLAHVAPVRAEAIGTIIIPTGEKDAALADNLTEVAMARIAETPGRTLVGAVELRRRIDAEGGHHVSACLEQPSCLGRIGVALGVTRLVTGAVRSDENRFFLSLNLTDLSTSRVQARFFRQVDGNLADLIRAVQDGVDELLNPKRAPGRLRVLSQPEGARVTVDDNYLGTTPLVSGDIAPGPHRVRVEMERRFPWKSTVEVSPGRSIDLALGPNDLRARRTWAPYVAYGTGVGAALGISTGAIFGTLAEVTPSGMTREEAQMDLGRRRTYGRIGTSLLVSSAVLAAVSAVVFFTHWRDIVGD